MYLVWYGFERTIVEGLRTDSLYLPFQIFGADIRVSQVLSAVIFITGIVFLITGAGGAFSNIITITGVSDAISDIVSGLTTNVFVVIILAYLVGLLIKQVTGSGTVSAITSMTIMSSVAPAVALPPVFIAMACLSGTLFGATVNDSGFWIVTNMSGLEFTGGVKTYTIPEMIESVVYLVIILLITAGYVMIF